jgi:hypothetical protein
MYCPLCKAEYRVGYDLCRGCDADLLFTKEQADAEDVVLFFESVNLKGIGELADALKAANVPNYSRPEKAKAKAPLTGLFANATTAKEQSWQIFVLDSDLDRARQVASAARFIRSYSQSSLAKPRATHPRSFATCNDVYPKPLDA